MSSQRGIDRAKLRQEAPVASSISDLMNTAIDFCRGSSGRSGCSTSSIWARGSSSSNHCLNPGLLRNDSLYKSEDILGKPGIQHLIEHEKELHDLFSTRATGSEPGFQPFSATDFDLLSAMQHFGAPTRLLDWSGSVHTALYFALESYIERVTTQRSYGATDQDIAERAEQGEVPCVWILRPRQLVGFANGKRDPQPVISSKDSASFERASYPDVIPDHKGDFPSYISEQSRARAIPVMPGHVTRRIVAQQGRFTLHPFAFDTLEDMHLESRESDYPEWLTMVKIDHTEAHRMHSELRDMGIHHFSVFPDMEGLGTYAARLFREATHNIQAKSHS